jgi:hypothetical protein
MFKLSPRVTSSTMNVRAVSRRIPWTKIVVALLIAVVAAWSVGFLAGLVVRLGILPPMQ